MGDILEVSDSSFESEIIKSEVPAMVDFWAEWCGPCKMVGPVVEELAGEYQGKIKIAKMDVDQNRETPALSAPAYEHQLHRNATIFGTFSS